MAINFPPGSPNNVNPGVTVTQIFTPTPNAPGPSVRIWNPSNGVAYVGGASVTQNTGIPVGGGNKPFELQNCPFPLYAISGVTPSTAVSSTISSGATAGSTQITVGGAMPAGLTTGATFVVGNTANKAWETNVVATSVSTTAFTFLNPLTLDHAVGAFIYLATPQAAAQLIVQAGVL